MTRARIQWVRDILNSHCYIKTILFSDTLTCDDVEKEGDLLKTRPASDMDLMTKTEFKECAADIGRLDLPQTHRAKFAATAVKVRT